MVKTDLMLEPATLEEWWKSYRLARTASYSQSPAWSELWCGYAGNRFTPSPLKAVFPSGKAVLVPLTVQKLRAGLGTVWHGSPAGTYGGWLCGEDKDLSPDEITLLIRALFRYCGSLTLRSFPELPGSGSVPGGSKNVPDASSEPGPPSTRPILQTAIDDLNGVTMTDDRTWLLDCAGGYGDIEEKWGRERPALVRNISKAKRNGVTIRLAETRRDVSDYHRLYLRSVERWDPPPVHTYPESFFAELALSGGADREHARELWFAEHEGKVIAGALILKGRNHSAYWHGAMDPESAKLRPVNLLIASIVASMCDEGIRWFDFNPSMGLSGVEKFKSSFGAVPAACPLLQRTSGTVRAATTAGRLANRIQKQFRR